MPSSAVSSSPSSCLMDIVIDGILTIPVGVEASPRLRFARPADRRTDRRSGRLCIFQSAPVIISLFSSPGDSISVRLATAVTARRRCKSGGPAYTDTRGTASNTTCWAGHLLSVRAFRSKCVPESSRVAMTAPNTISLVETDGAGSRREESDVRLPAAPDWRIRGSVLCPSHDPFRRDVLGSDAYYAARAPGSAVWENTRELHGRERSSLVVLAFTYSKNGTTFYNDPFNHYAA